MLRKVLCFFIVALISFVFSCEIFATEVWDDGGADHLWTTSANWSGNTVPNASDTVLIYDLDAGKEGPVIDHTMSGLQALDLRFTISEGETVTMTMTGGDLTLVNQCWMIAGTDTGTAVLNMTGGNLNIGTELRMGLINGKAVINLNGGTITASSIYLRANSFIDIRETGKLVILNNSEYYLNAHMYSGSITAYGGAGTVIINYNSGTNKTTVTAVEPSKAYDPVPFDTETDLSTDAILQWDSQDGADSYDVYFGTDKIDVENANNTSDEFIRNQNTMNISRSISHPSGLLEKNKTYYWRIDVIDGGNTTKGDVWSFTTDTVVTADASVPNPLIFEMKDCGVLKYNGEYYLIGTESEGDMRVSENLINWGPRIHVFTMNNSWATGQGVDPNDTHANDLKYINGVFHMYFQVSDFDLDIHQIGHAITTGSPLNAYTEPVTSTWFDGVIDPQIFIDDDGSYYFYKCDVGNYVRVHGQTMADPWTLTGSSSLLISAIAGTWDYRDYEINEGQFVIKYREKYYMLYNPNTSSYAYNNFALGCVESSGPMSFSNNDKYPEPVILARVSRGGHKITHFGQPTVLRGPNGFEWWMIYYAEYDGSRKCIAADRLLFFDRELFVAGPSSTLPEFTATTYMPPPAPATLGDLFNEGSSLGAHWNILSGTWDVSDGQARQTQTTGSDNKVLIISKEAKNYLVEVNVKLTDLYPPGEKAGITAYYNDPNNQIVVAIDQKNGNWFYNKIEDGNSTVTAYSLAGDFDYNVYHNIRVTKNNADFYVWIDELPAPGNPSISTGFDQAGLPGLYTQNAKANFDGFIYTIGWDECDEQITGWGSSFDGHNPTGSWSLSGAGISATNSGTVNRIYKGDMLSEYEFMAQVSRNSEIPADSEPHNMGIYPIFIDGDNWMIATIDLVNNRLKVYGERNGIDTENYNVSVEAAESYNLRVIKRSNAVRIFVDGELKVTVPMNWPASQVGLRAENIEAVYNGITHFALGSQYGSVAAEDEFMGDNFNDSIISSKWQHVSVHNSDITKQEHSILPDIVVHENFGRLQFSECEKGPDDSPWYGHGLKYNEYVYGNSISEIDFDSLEAYSDSSSVARSAIGLRIQKDSENWFEIRQTDDDDGDRLQAVAANNGVVTTSSLVYSITSGNLKIKFNNSNGLVEYFLNDSRQGFANVSGMKDSRYYVYITAYTSNTNNRILCNVDNFKINSGVIDLNNDWKVNFIDFAEFAQQWSNNSCDDNNQWCQGGDIDQSGEVDIEDLSVFAIHWLWDGLE